ncbi:MAG: gliding motility-associated C-terminal domain-containing protein [Salibacteraceae bacterium]
MVKLLASDMNTMDKFGRHAVAIDGDYAFVGAHYEQEDENGNNPMLKAGSVYIFQRDANGNWTEVQKIVPSDRTIEARFGYSISLSGNTAVIGAYLGNPDSINTGYQPKTGTAYVFELQPNGKWFETQKLYSDDGMTNDGFGCTVGISNGVIAIGARTHPLDVNGGNVILGAGAAYTFEKNGSGIWIQKQKLVSDSRFRDDLFGYNLAMDENLLVVGPHLFKKDTNGQWVHQQELMADQVNSIKNFEISVDISGEHIIIGNPLYDPNRVGQAYIFEANVSGKWLDQQLPIPLPHIHNPRFGTSVSIDGHRAFVSNTNHSLNANDQDTMYNAGATYMFQKNWNGQWLKQQKIVPNDRSNQDQFGEQTDIFNNFIIISSRNDTAITSSGVLNEPGAVYIFETPVCIESDTSYTVIECDSFIVPSNSMIYTAAGNYLVKDTIPNHCGGDSLLYIDLTILPPKASIINPTICYNDTVFVNNTPYHALNPIGIETIANVGPYNCDSIITIDLNVLPKNEVTISGILCEKDSLIVNGTIYHSGNLIGTETFVNIGPNGCDSTVNINLTKYSTMNIQFDSIDEVCENEEVVFTANIQHGKPPYSYLWSYNNLIGTIDNFMITASSTDTANISLWVTDHCNIAKKREQTVAVSNCQLVIPNIITPNGDGINDYFEIIGLDFGSTNHIQIFNRWGVLLFEQYNYLNNWDANKMPDGVYYYSLVIKNNGEEKNYSGPLTILRQ